MKNEYYQIENGEKGSRLSTAKKAGALIGLIIIKFTLESILGYLMIPVLVIALVVVVGMFLLISFPIFYVVSYLGLPLEIAFILVVVIMESLIVVPATILLTRRYQKKKAKREEIERKRRMIEEKFKKEETEPVEFSEWYGSWDYSDNEERLKSISVLRRSSSVSFTDEPESPEEYYAKRWKSPDIS